MFGLGFGEIFVIVLIGLLVFGPKKLPSLIKSISKTLVQLKRSSNELKYYVEKELSNAGGKEFEELSSFKQQIDEEVSEFKNHKFPQFLNKIESEAEAPLNLPKKKQQVKKTTKPKQDSNKSKLKTTKPKQDSNKSKLKTTKKLNSKIK